MTLTEPLTEQSRKHTPDTTGLVFPPHPPALQEAIEREEWQRLFAENDPFQDAVPCWQAEFPALENDCASWRER